ncbi:MAG: hypothetical protein FJ387_08605 [Verrucomicrobia bacterium]|nr:hypothetical protein [Verrucomicrobiota bacterium]
MSRAAVIVVALANLPLAAGDNLPLPPGKAETPETRTLTPVEAVAVLQRDWLFQAMGQPLLDRTAAEIGWTRELADRLSRSGRAPDLTREMRDLEELESRLGELRDRPLTAASTTSPETSATVPSWIWYPEGRPVEDAPAQLRWFRRRFELPAAAQSAVLRVAADDACEVFVNGSRVGGNETWQRTAAFDVGTWLKVGTNLLAVRAENRPAPTKNPAGLLARLAVTLPDGTLRIVVSDGVWRAEKTLQPGWEQAAFDDSGWPPALIAAPLGGGPWGNIAGLGPADLREDPVAAYAAADPAAKELYFAVRRIKREIFFANPLLDFTQLMFIDQPLPQGPESRHEAIHRMGIMASPGGRLLVLDGLHPGGTPRQLAPQGRPGSFWRPDLSFDARKALFCFKPHDEPSFHLYEMNLDGSGGRQLTDSPYDDIDPIYLPDGHILFTTTRGNSYVRCGPFIYSYILARCDADGSNVYLVSYNGEPDFVPALLNDGRVIYSRWEYTDKPLWRLQKLWTTNQDGTGTAHFWGNQSVWPDHLSEPRAIPGSRRVMFSGVGHHDWWSGSIGIIDPSQGRDYPHGLTKVTVDLPWPEVSPPPQDTPEAANYHASGHFTGYKTAYPLSDEDFLVSARGWGDKFRLYLMDIYGNRDLIYEGVHNVWHALPVRPRIAPPQQPDQVAWPGTGKDRKPVEPGVFFSSDVYQGVPELPRGAVKYLRVFQLDYKTYSTWNKTYRHSGPSVSIVQEEGVKRILSEVPVERDGSMYFEAPAGLALYFQLLDADRRCLQTMRSFTGLMPGERRGCVGCHEMHTTTPAPSSALALQRPPTRLSPPPWGTQSISYERFAQPVLDRYCVKCHAGTAEAPAEPNLVLRPGHSLFKEPYLTLVGPAGWGNPVPAGRPGYGIANAIPVESAYGQNDPNALTTLPPMTYLSCKSRLIDLAASGQHYGVKADPESLHRLIAWIDACCPFRGEEEIRALDDPEFPGIERLPIRPRVATAPVIERP